MDVTKQVQFFSVCSVMWAIEERWNLQFIGGQT